MGNDFGFPCFKMPHFHHYFLSDSKSEDKSKSTVGKNQWIAINTSKLELIYQWINYCADHFGYHSLHIFPNSLSFWALFKNSLQFFSEIGLHFSISLKFVSSLPNKAKFDDDPLLCNELGCLSINVSFFLVSFVSKFFSC